jgi:hypothetical protein
MKDKIISLLKSMHEMSQSEDWDECEAQELVVYGGELYEEYLRDKWDDVLNTPPTGNIDTVTIVQSLEHQPL